MEYAAIAAEGDHLLNSISTLHQDTLLSDDASVDVVKRSLEGTVWIDKDKDGKLEDGEKRVENVKVIIAMNHLKLMKKLYKMEIFIKQLHIQQQLQQIKTDITNLKVYLKVNIQLFLNHLIKHL